MAEVVIAFVAVNRAQNKNASTGDARSVYFPAMIVTFASLRRWNPELSLTLVSNALPPAPYAGQLAALRVGTRLVAWRHTPPPGFTAAFAGSLYLLDAFESYAADDEAVHTIFIDPDVVCLGSISELLADTASRVGALCLNYPVEQEVNGLSRSAALEIAVRLGSAPTASPYFGGELYVIPPHLLRMVADSNDFAWAAALKDFEAGRKHYVTEEHILNYSLSQVPHYDLSRYGRRIWTAHRYRNVQGDELELLLWHLPAEKQRMFTRVYEAAASEGSWFWTANRNVFADRVARLAGMHHRSPKRLATDFAGAAANKLRSLLSK